jgi:hypothetical protein
MDRLRAVRRGGWHIQEPDRLAAVVRRQPASDPKAHACRDAGLWRRALIQRGEQLAPDRARDAHGHHSEADVGGQGLAGIRRRRPHGAPQAVKPCLPWRDGRRTFVTRCVAAKSGEFGEPSDPGLAVTCRRHGRSTAVAPRALRSVAVGIRYSRRFLVHSITMDPQIGENMSSKS